MSETRTDVMAGATKSANWIGFGLIVLGVLALALPQQSGVAVAAGVGVILLLSGIFRILFLFMAPSWGSLFWRLLFGAAAVIAGGIMVSDPARGLNALTVITIIYFLVDGITEILLGFQFPPNAGGFWITASGVLSLILGIMMWRSWPVSGETALPILIGIKLLFTGIVVLAVARATRAVAARVG